MGQDPLIAFTAATNAIENNNAATGLALRPTLAVIASAAEAVFGPEAAALLGVSASADLMEWTAKLANPVLMGKALEKVQQDKDVKNKSASNTSHKSNNSVSSIPPEDWEPDKGRSNYKKDVIYPNNPKESPSSFEKLHGGRGARQNKNDKSIWDKDNTSHGGDQWKMWRTRRSWEKGEEPASIWPDGRVRKWGDQQ